MIRLFRHDGLEIMLNIDMIQEIRSGPKTVIVLKGGELLQVKNTQTDVMTKIRAHRKGREDEERALLFQAGKGMPSPANSLPRQDSEPPVP